MNPSLACKKCVLKKHMSRRAKYDEDGGFVVVAQQQQHQAKVQNQQRYMNMLQNNNKMGMFPSASMSQSSISPFLMNPMLNPTLNPMLNSAAADEDVCAADSVGGKGTSSCRLQSVLSSDNVIGFARGLDIDDGCDEKNVGTQERKKVERKVFGNPMLDAEMGTYAKSEKQHDPSTSRTSRTSHHHHHDNKHGMMESAKAGQVSVPSTNKKRGLQSSLTKAMCF